MSPQFKRIAACACLSMMLSAAPSTVSAAGSFPPNINPCRYQAGTVGVAYTRAEWSFWASGGCFQNVGAALAWIEAWNAIGGGNIYAISVNGVWSQVTPGGGTVGSPSEEFIQGIRNAFNRARQFREFAERNIGKLTEDQFNQINSAINDYNSRLRDAQRRYPGSFNNYRTISPIPSSWKKQSTAYELQYRPRSGGSWIRYRRYTSYPAADADRRTLERSYGAWYFFRIISV